jgi:hypothetical protein
MILTSTSTQGEKPVSLLEAASEWTRHALSAVHGQSSRFRRSLSPLLVVSSFPHFLFPSRHFPLSSFFPLFSLLYCMLEPIKPADYERAIFQALVNEGKHISVSKLTPSSIHQYFLHLFVLIGTKCKKN